MMCECDFFLSKGWDVLCLLFQCPGPETKSKFKACPHWDIWNGLIHAEKVLNFKYDVFYLSLTWEILPPTLKIVL